MPVFVEEFLNVVDNDTHFVFCNMVHNWTNKQYLVINSIPKLGGIDIGNFMSRSDLAKKIKFKKTHPKALKHKSWKNFLHTKQQPHVLNTPLPLQSR